MEEFSLFTHYDTISGREIWYDDNFSIRFTTPMIQLDKDTARQVHDDDAGEFYPTWR